jgi:serine/threonine protein phosphatase PrpC
MFAMGGVSWYKCLLVIVVPWLIRLVLLNEEQGISPVVETRPCEVKVHGNCDASMNWAASLTQGKRPAMEDYFVALPGIPLKSALRSAETTFLAVFDGHGGWETGAFLTQRLHEYIASTVDFGDAGVGRHEGRDKPDDLLPRELERKLEAAYLKADLEWMEQAVRKNLRAGSTATTALLLGNLLICPNVGDSRTVICSRGKAREMSEDHKPDLPRERARIEALG